MWYYCFCCRFATRRHWFQRPERIPTYPATTSSLYRTSRAETSTPTHTFWRRPPYTTTTSFLPRTRWQEQCSDLRDRRQHSAPFTNAQPYLLSCTLFMHLLKGKMCPLLYGSHPNIYRLIDFTKTEQSFVEATILQLAVGGTIHIRKEKYRQPEDALHRFKVQFQNGDRSVMNYVDAVSHLTGR